MIRQALRAATERLTGLSDSPRLDAELLLAHILGWNRARLRSHDDERLTEDAAGLFESLISRRSTGEPVAYLLGFRDFWKSRFAVGPGVLVPRPETELLVEIALTWLTATPQPRVLDLGTGSGAIGLSIALDRPDARVTLIDQSAVAVRTAEENRRTLSAEARILHGAWFEPVRDEQFELILSNPPYIAPGDPHLTAWELQHEPAEALVASEGGMIDLRTIIQQAPEHLCRQGRLLLEHGHDQGAQVRKLLISNGFSQTTTFCDLAGRERATGGVFGD